LLFVRSFFASFVFLLEKASSINIGYHKYERKAIVRDTIAVMMQYKEGLVVLMETAKGNWEECLQWRIR
jgi:hypothetical protein